MCYRYFISNSDQIKNIEHPTDDFQFFITNNERYNNVQREAMHSTSITKPSTPLLTISSIACIRNEVVTRLASLNVHPLYLPNLSSQKPSGTAHLPILTTNPTTLRSKSRVIVIVNRSAEDLAIWAYRILSKSGGINSGSAVSFVKEAVTRSEVYGAGEEDVPGFIILNPGQLLYSHKHERAMTTVAWDALPRKSATHPMPRVHPVHNRIPGNKTAEDHVAFVFDKVVGSPEFVNPDAQIYIVGLGDGGDEVIKYLEKNCTFSSLDYIATTQTNNTTGSHRRGPTIAALALTAPTPLRPSISPIPLTNRPFLTFLSNRARAWLVSHFPLGTPLANAAAISTFCPPPDAAAPQSRDTPYVSADTNATTDTASANGITTTTSITIPETTDDDPEANISLFPCLSGGTSEYAECVMPCAYREILDWFEAVARGSGGIEGEEYANEVLEVPEEVLKEMEEEILAVPAWGEVPED